MWKLPFYALAARSFFDKRVSSTARALRWAISSISLLHLTTAVNEHDRELCRDKHRQTNISLLLLSLRCRDECRANFRSDSNDAADYATAGVHRWLHDGCDLFN